MDSVDKAFEDISVLNLCLKRIHWFSPGIPGLAMRTNTDQCASCGHWSFILNGLVDPASLTVKSLFVACRAKHFDVIRAIVLQGVDINNSDKYGWSALHIAAVQNDDALITCLLDLGAVDAATCDGIRVSDLRNCTWEFPDNTLDIIKNLVNSITDENPIPSGVLAGRILRVVNEHGKDMLVVPDIELDTCWYTLSVIEKSIMLNWVGICRLCLELGISANHNDGMIAPPIMNVKWYESKDCFDLLMEYGADVNLVCDFGVTPLSDACANGFDDAVEMFLDAGADYTILNSYNQLPLHLACDIHGNVECIRLLLEHGAHVLIDVPMPPYQWTPLHIVCNHGTLESVRLLLDYGANPNLCNNTGATPLHFACQQGDVEVARLLLSRNADPLIPDQNQCLPIFAALDEERIECIRLLLEHGVSPGIRNEAGQTLLHEAYSADNREISRLVSEYNE